MPPVCSELFIFFTECNRCLSSAARSQANGGILIIALATGRGLAAAEGEPVSHWLLWTAAESTEFHLMKRFSAAAASCSQEGGGVWGGPGVCHFSLSISSQCKTDAQACIVDHLVIKHYLHVNFRRGASFCCPS